MKINTKAGLSVVMTLAIAATSAVSVFAAPVVPTAPGQQPAIVVAGNPSADVPVQVTATAATFNVTVPTVLPVNMDEMGVIAVSDQAKIINNSATDVKVTALSVTDGKGEDQVATTDDWKVVAFTPEGLLKEKVGTRKVALKLNSEQTTAGAISFSQANWLPIAKDANLPIVYMAQLPTQKVALTDAKVMQVVFTIGWDEAVATPGV